MISCSPLYCVGFLLNTNQIGDSALYLALLGLFVNELADMKLSFFLFCAYVGATLLSPVMHNLWIWRGTGNTNFYLATPMAYASLQIILVVESVSAMLHHDRKMYGDKQQISQEARKRFDKASLLYDQAREKFLSLRKGTKVDIVTVLEEELHNTRATFEQARFNLVLC